MVFLIELSILDGSDAALLNTDLSVVGDIDVSGVLTADEIPIENLSNVDKQSFDNLIDNGDFKLWPAGVSAAPGDWTLASGCTVLQENTIKKIGAYSVKLTASHIYSKLTIPISDPTRYNGKEITVCCLVHCSTASAARIFIIDSVTSTPSKYHTGGGDWEWICVTRTIDPSSTSLDIALYPDRGSGATFAYFDGVMVVEGSICPTFSPKPLSDPHTHGEMYIYNNSTATVIETADTPIAIRQISEGLTSGFIFHVGSTGSVLGYTDYSGTVAGAVLVTCSVAHGLTTGDIITIRGTTNYNGIFQITTTGANNEFYIMDTWVADDGASDWDQGASLTAQPGADGVYDSTWQMTAAPAGACRAIFFININTTPQVKSGAPRELAINDEDNNSSTCLLEIVAGDIIWLSVQSDSTTDITHAYGNINIGRK